MVHLFDWLVGMDEQGAETIGWMKVDDKLMVVVGYS